MNLLSKINKPAFKHLSVSFLTFITIFNFIAFYFVQSSGEVIDINNARNQAISLCSENIVIYNDFDLDLMSEKSYQVTSQHVDIYPELNNLNCLEKL